MRQWAWNNQSLLDLVTVYEDKNCKVNGVTILEKMCLSHNDEGKWQSYAVRGCDRVA